MVPRGGACTAAIAEAPTSAAGSPYTDPEQWEEGAGGTTEAEPFDHVYTWITALGVVFFAISLPTMMVPWISSSLHMAQSVVSSAVQSSSLIAGSAATGMASGAANARAGGGGLGSMIRGGLMGAGTAGMHAAGTAGMPMGGIGPAPGEMARGLGSAQKAMEGAAGSAQATTAKFDSLLDHEAGKGLSKDNLKALRNSAHMGGGQGSLIPQWKGDLSNEINAENISEAFTDKKGSAFAVTRGIATGMQAATMSPMALDGWTKAVGETRGKLGNPELSTSGLDSLVEAKAEKMGPDTNKVTLKNKMVEEGMRLRGLEPDNAAHKKAFMSDLAANDVAIQERGGVEYENGKWWRDESNGGNPHRGRWEATNAELEKSKISEVAGAGQMQGGAGTASGATGGAPDSTAGGGAGSHPSDSQSAGGSQEQRGTGREAESQTAKLDPPGNKRDL